MEMEKRKREDDGESNGKFPKAKREEEAAAVAGEEDDKDEVDEFFAILKRMHVAIQYFQTRNGGRELTARSLWSQEFANELEPGKGDKRPVLDLNSHPDNISDSSAV